jgi:predicted HTH domain antitoxin
MEKLVIDVPEDLLQELQPYQDHVVDLLRLGLREMKMEQTLALFKKGDISLWKAARMAGVSLREMTQCAVAHGLRATCDEETLAEELA